MLQIKGGKQQYNKCYHDLFICTWNLHDGGLTTSPVTIAFKPRLPRAPRIRPQENAKYLGINSVNCLDDEILQIKRKR